MQTGICKLQTNMKITWTALYIEIESIQKSLRKQTETLIICFEKHFHKFSQFHEMSTNTTHIIQPFYAFMNSQNFLFFSAHRSSRSSSS